LIVKLNIVQILSDFDDFAIQLKQSGDIMSDSTIYVIFGASGDLSRRKLIPALFNLFTKKQIAADFQIIGIAGRSWSHDDFRRLSHESLLELGGVTASEVDWNSFAAHLTYYSGDFNKPETYQFLKTKLAEVEKPGSNHIYYLATPPEYFLEIIDGLAKTNQLSEKEGWRRVVIEKPFGSDLQSAKALNQSLHEVMDEHQVYRIDHYLGKETVQNILVARFANTIFEPIWNRNYIDSVQITVAEKVGVETRGKYYDKAGVVRDMFQNHLLQLLTLVAMEPTSSYKADALRDEKVKVISAIRPIAANEVEKHTVRGQYRGYTAEPNVAPDSKTATFAAMRFLIDNWRWQGVPFYLRSGKKMAQKVSEIIIQFKTVPHRIFPMQADFCGSSNLLSLCLQPDEGMHLRFEAKVPGTLAETRSVNMDFNYRDEFGPNAYERLLLDVSTGEASLFTRADQTELSWQLIDPILQGWDTPYAPPLSIYEPGTWGPDDSARLLGDDQCEWEQICGKN
jgi:glucose-6-phosphate 1-dehydrogenase